MTATAPNPVPGFREKYSHRRRTAIHEAGHAVADVVLGIIPEYVSVRPGRTFRGVAVAQHPVEAELLDVSLPVSAQPPVLRAGVERLVIALLAGDLAALHLAPRLSAGYHDEDEGAEIARQALATLGPRLAELVVANEDAVDTGGSDEDKAHDITSAFVGPDGGSAFYLEWLRCESRTLVVRYRSAIYRVADALERQAVLRGAQVAALVYPSTTQEKEADV